MATTLLATPAATPSPIAGSAVGRPAPALQFPMFPASAGINQGPALVQGMKNVGAFFDTPPNLATAPRLPSAMPGAAPVPGAPASVAGRGTINPVGVNDVTGGSAAAGAMPLPGMTSPAGGGRGALNPPAAALSGAARPDLADLPSLGGSTGTAVDGAAGVRRFTPADGRTLYSNVAGADSDKLMSGSPGMQTVPAMTGMATQMSAPQAAAPTYAQPGVLTSTPGLSIGSGRTIFDDNRADAAAQTTTSALGGAVSGRELARLANQRSIAADQNATSRANTLDVVGATREGHELSAGTSRYATEAGMTNAATAALAHITGSNIAASAAGHSADQSLAGVMAGVSERATQFAGTPRAIGQHIEMINGLPTTVTTYGMPAGQAALTPINSTPEKPTPAEGSTGTLKDGRKFKIVNGQPVVVQ